MARSRAVTRVLIPLLAAALVTFSPVARAAEGAKSRGLKANDIYVVRMIDNPVVSYTGGVPGLRATKPRAGTKIDPLSPDVVAYVGYLDGRHDAAVAAVQARKVYDYRYSFNGFAARMTPAQAAALAKVAGVVAVDKDQFFEVDTSQTPTFLGLDAPGGLWEMLGGTSAAGEGIIIGIIDSGIWPESPSFSDRSFKKEKDGKLAFQQIPGWHGRCVPGEAFDASLCNQKLIGAQYFNAGQGGNAAVDADMPWEFNSVRDYNGHGSHTASTAGGNNGVATIGPTAIFGPISGMAPRARIAAYKALWSLEDASTASGAGSDLVAAIDQAVADGVDVINYSISGSQTSFRDAVEIAFMYAADAGVFVAASAGNSGPASSTVAHPGPWLTTVAAGTHSRDVQGSVTLGNGQTYHGASLASPVGPAPFIDSLDAGMAGADPAKLALCLAAIDNGGVAVLDPAKVGGKIVLCDRGSNARVNKSLAVAEAGGVGMVLVNPTTNSLNADFHYVPTVHLQATDRAAVKAYAATPGATATINQSVIVANVPAPFTASFSSRGPLRASADLLKPDVIAPGQDILAAVSPMVGGMYWNLYSGTSMSSPHVAGLGALLKDLHPTWTPMMIKSALMTTAYDVLDGPNTNPLVIFRQGAGHVRPNLAADPGLVYPSSLRDWLGFLCGTQLDPSYCTSRGIPVLDPSNLNGASIAIGDLAGTQTVTRSVVNVGNATTTYTASTTGLAGISAVVSPASFTLPGGATQNFTVTFTTTTAAMNANVGGYLTWTGGGHAVRSPIVIRPVALSAPAEVRGSYNVTFGYAGSFTASPRGLVPATTNAGTVLDDPTDNFLPNGPGTTSVAVTIPAGTTYARFSLFDAAVSPASDLDLYVYNSGGTLVGSSGGGTSAEEVNLVNPAAGTYTVFVHGYSAAPAPGTSFTLYSWSLGSTDAGNMTVTAPSTATIGGTGTIDLTFNGLASGTKYLGSVAYSGAAGMPSPTIVRVDP